MCDGVMFSRILTIELLCDCSLLTRIQPPTVPTEVERPLEDKTVEDVEVPDLLVLPEVDSLPVVTEDMMERGVETPMPTLRRRLLLDGELKKVPLN